MIYTLTLNAALDYDMYIDDIVMGELNLAKEVNYRAGGKGINVSKVLRNLDVDSIALGYVGGFVGKFIEEDLKKNGINSKFIELDGCTRINVKINDKDTETELTGLSPKISEDKIEKLFDELRKLNDGDILILAGSIPSSISQEIYRLLSENIDKNVEIVLDTRGNLIQDNILNNLLIKPNIHELREMFGEKLESKAKIVDKCKYFLDRGIKNIIVSRGGEGALLINKDIVLEASVPKGKLINSIGAGDSMVAGFVAGFVKGLTLENSFKLAVACGSATAYSYGLAEKSLIDKLYSEIEVIKEVY